MSGHPGEQYYSVVVNDDGDHGRWPVGRKPPTGWRFDSFHGTAGACERHVTALAAVRYAPARGAGAARDADDRFAAVAERHPDATAIREGAAHLSYGELRAWVDGLAEALRAAGLRVGDGVVVHASGRAEAVAGLLAALRAGEWPRPRAPTRPRTCWKPLRVSSGHLPFPPRSRPAVGSSSPRATTPASCSPSGTSCVSPSCRPCPPCLRPDGPTTRCRLRERCARC
ncbi:AMP-binding protein [Luedemannella flava]